MKLTVVPGDLDCQVQSKGSLFLAASKKSFSPTSVKKPFLVTNVALLTKNKKDCKTKLIA